MAACTRCGFQQNGTQTYCERCGMFLPALAVYNPNQPEYTIAPQVTPSQFVPQQQQRFLESNQPTLSILSKCIREGIAIIGLLIAAFGLLGTFEHILNPGIILVLQMMFLLGSTTSVSVYLFVKKISARLHWLQILVSAILATVALVITLVVISAIVQTNVIGRDLGYGTTLFLYGLVLVALVVV